MQSLTHDQPLLLVGCGNMGRAMAEGWLAGGLLPEALYIADPGVNADALPGVPPPQFLTSGDMLNKEARVIIVAVKPQMMDTVLPTLASVSGANTLIISIAAGTAVARFEAAFGAGAKVIRAMPNTPAAIGKGVSGLFATAAVGKADYEIACSLMAAVGPYIWVESENLINSVTAVSGSGPAYVFHMVEALAAAAVQEGLSEKDAMTLARETIIGAGALLAAQPDVEAKEFRKRVTSPGGTTAAALEVLMADNGLGTLIAAAVRAARKRGEQLV